MIQQEINLYLPEFRPKKILLSFSQCIFLVVLAIAGLWAYTWLSFQGLDGLRLEAEGYREEMASVDKKINEAGLLFKVSERRDNLEGKINQLSEEVFRKKKIKSIYSDSVIRNQQGFSAFLIELGKQNTGGLAIEDISIIDYGREVFIRGLSVSGEVVLAYVDALSKQEAFANSRFGLLTIRKRETPDLVEFYMKDKSEDELDLQ